MTTCYLDANILYYLEDPASPLSNQTEELLERLVRNGVKLVISPLVLDEYMITVIRHSGKSRAEAKEMLKESIKSIFKLPKIKMVNPPLDQQKNLHVMDLIIKYNLLPRDAYHLLIMLENEIEYLASFDQDFKKVFSEGKIKNALTI